MMLSNIYKFKKLNICSKEMEFAYAYIFHFHSHWK
jgi:hypothetical protein